MPAQGGASPALVTRKSELHGRTPRQIEYLHIQEHDITFGTGPAGTGKTPLAVACAVDAFERELVSRIVLTRRRSRPASAWLPARRSGAEGRPLPAPALRCALRPDGLRPRDEDAGKKAGDRNRAAGLYARPHAEPRLHHSRRGAEHHAGADEDVPTASASAPRR